VETEFLKRIEINFFRVFEKILYRLKISDFLVPDHFVFEILTYFPIILWKLTEYQFDYIYAQGSSFSIFILGFLLQFFYKKPLILEYIDVWTDNPYARKLLHKDWLNKKLERFLLKKADFLIFMAEPLRDFVLSKFHLEELKKKSRIILGAPDLSIFQEIHKYPKPKEMIVISTCSFYGLRKMEPFLRLIRDAKNANRSNRFFIQGIWPNRK
jgi:hypothetical protein